MKTIQNPVLSLSAALAFASLSHHALAQNPLANPLKQPLAQNQLPLAAETKQAPYLGVSMQNLAAEEAHELGLNEQGVKLGEIFANSPAESAGLEKGDILLSVNGDILTEPQDLIDTIQALKPDEEITLKLIRDREQKTLKATLAPMPDVFKQQMQEARRLQELLIAPQIQLQPLDVWDDLPFFFPDDFNNQDQGRLIFPEPIPGDLDDLLINPDEFNQEIAQFQQQMQLNANRLQLQIEQLQKGELNGMTKGRWTTKSNGKTTIEMRDENGRVRITQLKGEKPFVEVFDKENELLYSESLSGLEDTLDHIPKEYKERIRSALPGTSNPFSLEIHLGDGLGLAPLLLDPEAKQEMNEPKEPNQKGAEKGAELLTPKKAELTPSGFH